MQRVLLLGDSIRLFYDEEVKKELGTGYEVFGPEENCRFSKYVLNSIRFWLTEYAHPDIIHWNAGLWDTAILYPEDGCFTDVEEYVDTMKKILRELQKTGAKIIFSTTTPVSEDKKDWPGPMPPAHDNNDIIRYNQAILNAFKEEDVLICDLHSCMYAEKEKYLGEDKIHPNEEGCKLLAKAVAAKIRNVGDYKNSLTREIDHAEFIKTEQKTLQ